MLSNLILYCFSSTIVRRQTKMNRFVFVLVLGLGYCVRGKQILRRLLLKLINISNKFRLNEFIAQFLNTTRTLKIVS